MCVLRLDPSVLRHRAHVLCWVLGFLSAKTLRTLRFVAPGDCVDVLLGDSDRLHDVHLDCYLCVIFRSPARFRPKNPLALSAVMCENKQRQKTFLKGVFLFCTHSIGFVLYVYLNSSRRMCSDIAECKLLVLKT